MVRCLSLVAAFAASLGACTGDGPPSIVAPSDPSSAPVSLRPSAVWEDREACEAVLRARPGEARKDARLRVATWNIRWFPDGKPGKTPREDGGTDLMWLACAIAWLDPDVMAMNELKLVEHGVVAVERVLERLREHTGATWKWAADSCRDLSRQHVGLIYRTDRVRLDLIETRGEVDPTVNASGGTPDCPGRLRPALTAYVSSTRPNGADFHLGVVHLDSGRETRDFANRELSWNGIAALAAQRMTARPDRDFMLIGDYNTMGCEKCGIPDARAEIELLAQRLSAQALPLRLASRDIRCTEYYRDKGTTLDHIAVAQEMEEAAGQVARVEGLCATLACRPAARDDNAVLDTISDHCPVVIDIADRDQDPGTTPPPPGQVSAPASPSPPARARPR